MPNGGGTGEAESIGELSRWVAALRVDIRGDLEEIKHRFDRLEFVSPQVYAADRHTDLERYKAVVARIADVEKASAARIADVEKDLAAAQDNSRWLWRTVVSALIVTAFAVILAASGFPH